MNRIFKFPLEATQEQHIMMPTDARILSVHDQDGRICLWVLVDDKLPNDENRCFVIFGTGHPINRPLNNLAFIGTAHLSDGALVFHVFELIGI